MNRIHCGAFALLCLTGVAQAAPTTIASGALFSANQAEAVCTLTNVGAASVSGIAGTILNVSGKAATLATDTCKTGKLAADASCDITATVTAAGGANACRFKAFDTTYLRATLDIRDTDSNTLVSTQLR